MDLLEAAKKGKNERSSNSSPRAPTWRATDREGRTPLMLAAQYGRTTTVRLLLDKGAKPGARDAHGWTAYMLALLAPSGGVVHTTHDAVLKLLPQPKRFRIAIDASWAPGKELFSSCFMRPPDLTAAPPPAAPRRHRDRSAPAFRSQFRARPDGDCLRRCARHVRHFRQNHAGRHRCGAFPAGRARCHLRAAVRPGQHVDPRHPHPAAG